MSNIYANFEITEDIEVTVQITCDTCKKPIPPNTEFISTFDYGETRPKDHACIQDFCCDGCFLSYFREYFANPHSHKRLTIINSMFKGKVNAHN